MQSQYFETQAQVSQIIGSGKGTFKIISQNKENNHYVLVELADLQRIIVDLTEQKIYSTKTLDAGISFEGTGHVLGKELVKEDLVFRESSYKGHALTLRIMDILNLSSEVGWSVVDSLGDLHLVHYNDDADMTLVGHLRGVLVDVKEGLSIASSFGYTPTVCTNELVVSNGEITLYDDYNHVHTFGDETMIKRIYEGVIMRVIYYNGEVYRMTHKKIRPMKSRFGNSPFFTKMYQEAGGPLDHQMFDLSKQWSPMCFVFLVVHPKLLMATRQHVISPYVVLLSINQMWNPLTCPFPQEEVELECRYNFPISPYISATMTEPFVHLPEAMSLEAANKHLLYGYYDNVPSMDLRQLPGEALILYKFKDGQVVDIVKVNSIAYDYRFNIRQNDSNPYRQFYNLANNSYQSLSYHTNYVEFKQKFMLFDHYTKEDLQSILKSEGKILYLNHGDIGNRKDRQSILEMVWLNYVLSLPFNMQLEATSFLEKFLIERDQVSRWLQGYEISHLYLDKNDVTERGVGLISAARSTAVSNVQKKHPKDRQEAIKLEQEETKIIINNYIMNEFGTSLYALVKKMKNTKEQ